MKRHSLYYIIIICGTMLTTSRVALFAQERNNNDNTSATHTLISGIGYANNMIYMGSNLSQGKPLYSGSVTYGFKDEFFVSASGNHLAAFDPFLAFSVFSLSYNHNFNTWLDASLSVSRYQVNNELADTLFGNFFYGNLAVGVDWNILYTNLSVGGIFSEGNSAYLQLRNSRYFETGEILKGRVYFSFDPYINLLAGTLTKTVTADGTVIGVSQPYKSSKTGSGQHSSASTTDFFSLMEIDSGVTVALNTERMTFEVEPGYVLPAYSVSDDSSPKGFTLFLSLYFSIIN
jgi:hypothetical protein